jgi:putative ABC transport system permease protein
MDRFLYLLALARKSAWSRRGTLVLVVLSVALSTLLLLGMERARTQVRDSFVQAVSGTDLVVGARGGPMQLMLYAVFHLGGATNNMGWDSARRLAEHPDVAWTIPLSLGDSHRGYPVVATTKAFFEHYRFRAGESLALASGRMSGDLFDLVVGSEVAKRLSYAPGSTLVLSHGSGGANLPEHRDSPFTVTGVLSPTGTPADRSLYISLEAMEAIHLGWQGGAPAPGLRILPGQARKFSLEPKSITALLVGLKKRSRVFALQREVNEGKEEALMAVMPGVAMDQIWRLVSSGERALLLISGLVTVTGLAGLVSTVLAGLGERRRELAILRAAGARPLDILILLSWEGMLVLLSGMALGLTALALLIAVLGPALLDRYGLALSVSAPSGTEALLLCGIALAGFLASLIPALRAYRLSLSDGLGSAP